MSAKKTKKTKEDEELEDLIQRYFYLAEKEQIPYSKSITANLDILEKLIKEKQQKINESRTRTSRKKVQDI